MLSLFLFSAVGSLLALHRPSLQENAPAKPVVRSCPDSWNEAPHGKKYRPSGKKKNPPKESGACVELASSPLEIQEYLQSFARQERWSITADQLSEDSWTFSLEIDKDELLRDTVDESSPKGIEWTGGTVRVHLSTLQLPDGFARTTVRASFRGFGRNTDQFAMQKEYWELESSNAFENSIASALRNHFSPLPAAKSSTAQPSP